MASSTDRHCVRISAFGDLKELRKQLIGLYGVRAISG